MAEKKDVKVKIKKKKWVEILAPRYYQHQQLGESLVVEPEMLLNRHINVNLMTLTRDMKKQNINVDFLIDKIENGKAYTSVVAFEMIPASIRRLVRRSKDRIDESFLATTKDGIKIRVKPFILTKNNCSRPLQTKIRNEARKLIIETVATIPYEVLIVDLGTGKLQKFLFNDLKKIYPLRSCEIRKMNIERKTGFEEHAKEIPAEQPVIEEVKQEQPEEVKEEKKHKKPKKKKEAAEETEEDSDPVETEEENV